MRRHEERLPTIGEVSAELPLRELGYDVPKVEVDADVAIRALAVLKLADARTFEILANHWVALLIDALESQVPWEDVAIAIGPPIEPVEEEGRLATPHRAG